LLYNIDVQSGDGHLLGAGAGQEDFLVVGCPLKKRGKMLASAGEVSTLLFLSSYFFSEVRYAD
jgi:hypothetical protein